MFCMEFVGFCEADMASTFSVFVVSFRAYVVLAVEGGAVRSAENRRYGGVCCHVSYSSRSDDPDFCRSCCSPIRSLGLVTPGAEGDIDECASLVWSAERGPE